MKLKLPLALHAAILAAMVSSSNSYATTTHPAGQELQMQQGGTGSATVQWKPAPVDADDEDETGGNGKKKNASVDLTSATVLTQDAINAQSKAPEVLANARATLSPISKKRTRSGDVRLVSRRDADGNIRVELVLGKDEVLPITMRDTLAFWNHLEGYIPSFFPQIYIPDGSPSVAVDAKQTIILPATTATGTFPLVKAKPTTIYTAQTTGTTPTEDLPAARTVTTGTTTLTASTTRLTAPAPFYGWFGNGHRTAPRTVKNTTKTGKDKDKDKDKADEEEFAGTEDGQTKPGLRNTTLTGTTVSTANATNSKTKRTVITLGSLPAGTADGKDIATYTGTAPNGTAAPMPATPPHCRCGPLRASPPAVDNHPVGHPHRDGPAVANRPRPRPGTGGAGFLHRGYQHHVEP